MLETAAINRTWLAGIRSILTAPRPTAKVRRVARSGYDAASMQRLRAVLLAAGLAAPAPAQAPPPPPPPVRDYDAHVAALRPRLPHERFTIVVQPPFVVVGDEEPAVVRRRAERTVRWAVDLLRKEFFDADPDAIIDVWLFKNRASYEKHTRTLFGEKPTTPFGYYSAKHRALVMNIATGGGTLVHEIVHPFVAADFPQCPAWLNEGLGSLFEQCEERDGRIRGLPNWRLAGLQKSLADDSVPTFAALTATTTTEFYGEDRGTNYAQARYLCYWLQEKGLLQRFYREFRRDHRADPTGHAKLLALLGSPDVKACFTEWKRFVLDLRYP
jgi:hypothetical protein